MLVRHWRSRKTSARRLLTVPVDASRWEPSLDAPSPAARAFLDAALPFLAVAWFLVIAATRAWLCDDAFVSFRVADHFVHGRGLVYNAGERVQGFTNPLWVLLYAIPHALPGDPYLQGVALCLAVSGAAAAVLVYRFAKNLLVGSLGVVALSFSEAAGDFATSGLENPLSHLLVLAFAASVLQREAVGSRLLAPWLCVGLALTNRIDLGMLLLPGLVAVAVVQARTASKVELLRRALVGLSPFLLWEAFALVYYGSLVPNTAIAKLGVSLPRGEVIGQGVMYLFVSAGRDPLTMLVITTGIAWGLASRRTRPLALGVLLQVLYTVWVGGDFMAGRFLSAPLYLAAAICLTLIDGLDAPRAVEVCAGIVAFVAVLSPYRPFREGPADRNIPASGIVSEREFYRTELGLGVNLRHRTYKDHGLYKDGLRFRKEAERVVFHPNAGLTAYAAGPHRHLVDAVGLADPFVARMPRKKEGDWRIGHYGREIPKGYLPTLKSGTLQLEERRHRELFQRLALITRGPIFSWKRFEAIVWMHTHRFGVER
jgi:arabinofuranosyltransferase